MAETVESFVRRLSDDQLRRLFVHYGCYAHLLLLDTRTPVEPGATEDLRLALRRYLARFAVVDDPDNDRALVLLRAMHAGDNGDALVDAVTRDQYIEEPLMHVFNQNTAYYTLSEQLMQRILKQH